MAIERIIHQAQHYPIDFKKLGPGHVERITILVKLSNGSMFAGKLSSWAYEGMGEYQTIIFGGHVLTTRATPVAIHEDEKVTHSTRYFVDGLEGVWIVSVMGREL